MSKADIMEPPTPVAANPKPNLRNNPAMFTIFHNVQFNVVQHKKYVKEMSKLYKKLDEQSFRESFKNALLYMFKFGDTSANVDRVIQFVATFCTALDDEEEFLEFVFGIIFDSQCVISQAVRYRASQLLAAILAALGADASLDDALCDKLLASQKQRLQDARGAVRCRAALALQRLQDPMDPDDEVTKGYRFHMSCDPSSSVRRAVVMSIAKSTRNVPFVLERLCDVDEAVRRAAFLYVAAINVTQLRVRQRVHTLKVGLTERSPRVRRVVEEILIPGWLASFQGNIITLLTAIRLDNRTDAKDSQYVAGKLLESLFKRLPVSELLEWLPTDKTLRLIPADKLNKETAWYWRHLAEHLQRTEDDTLEAIMPDLVVLAGYIRAIVESQCPSEADDPVGFSTRQYVLQELGSMLAVYDVSDPTSRDALHKLLVDVLTGDHGPLTPEVIRVFVRALDLVVPELSPRLELVSGVITSLREPEEPDDVPPPVPAAELARLKHKRGNLRISLNVAMEAQEEAVRDQNYALAADCKAKVEELQKMLDEVTSKLEPQLPPAVIKEKLSDSETLNKCLVILNCALDTPQLTALTPMLRIIFSELETEIFKNPDLLETALETVAIYGQLDKDFAKQTKSFFFANLCDTSNESTVSVVLRCIIDLMCVHGARVFEHDVDTEARRDNTTADDNSLSCSNLSLAENQNTVLELLLKLMDSESPVYRQIIVEGLCRLLYLGNIESPAVLSRLLLLWFNPTTVEEDMLRQIIGVFFQTFPAVVDGAQEQIQKATIPTLRALANAPSSSPLAEIDQEAVVKFIVSLTRVNHELCDSQGGMAQVLCQQLSRAPAAPHAALLCRALALLAPPRDHALAAALARQLPALCAKLPDKQSCRNLTKYLSALEAFERASSIKMSHTGVTEGTIQEDSLAPLGRTTGSMPQPIARSTHVMINETVEEQLDIDETSPPHGISTITEEQIQAQSSPRCPTDTNGPTPDEVSRKSSESQKSGTSRKSSDPLSDSSDVSPVKKSKITKGKKKKLSLNRQASEPNPSKSKQKGAQNTKSLEDSEEGRTEEGGRSEEVGGVKRTRSQRSLVDVDRAQKAKAESAKKASSKESSPETSPDDFANVTIRRTTTGPSGSSSDENRTTQKTTQNKKTAQKTIQKKKDTKQTVKKPSKSCKTTKQVISRESDASVDSYKPFDDSADEDTLHTIVYDQEFVQSVLNDSSELAEANRSTSRGNITIPETPDASEESDVEEPQPAKGKKK